MIILCGSLEEIAFTNILSNPYLDLIYLFFLCGFLSPQLTHISKKWQQVSKAWFWETNNIMSNYPEKYKLHQHTWSYLHLRGSFW